MRRRSIRCDDRDRVVNAAVKMRVSEYVVFQIAYRAWYRQDVNKEFLDRGFANYLFSGEAPCWVRHFVRRFTLVIPLSRRQEIAVSFRWVRRWIAVEIARHFYQVPLSGKDLMA